MSVPFLDYLPCDLTTYSQTVLPAWREAHQRNFQPLRELISSAQHISSWPVFYLPNPLPDVYFSGPQGCFGNDFFSADYGFCPQFLQFHGFPIALQFLQAVCDFWHEEYSPQLSHSVSNSCRTIQRIETETPNRLRSAVERGWGMLKIWQV